jgi:transcriptional regulator with XRE-family HTH domain
MLFRQKLIAARENAKLTQESTAEKSGVPLPTLRRYEQGASSRVPFGVVTRLAKALGVTCEYFADCEDVAAEDAKPTKVKLAKKAKK